MITFFFSFFEQYQSEYHCYSKCLALSFSEALDLQGQLSLTPAGPSAGQSVVQLESGGERECPPSASLLWSSGCQAAAPTAQHFLPGSTWPSLSLARKSSSSKTSQSRLSATHGISNGGGGGPPLIDPAVVPALSPISQFFNTKITLAGRCNSHISGNFCQCTFYFFEKIIWLYFFQCVILLLLSTCSGLQNTGYWTSPSLFICRNTLVRGASVCSSCVLNAKRGSILQSVIDCLFVLNWSCSYVWQYSVVFPGSILRCVKNRVSQTGVRVYVAPSCSGCPQAVPPCPLPSCYAMTSSPPPPQPDPVALPWPGTNKPSYLFLCKRLEAGALYSMPTWLGNEYSSQTKANPNICPPCASVSTSEWLLFL